MADNSKTRSTKDSNVHLSSEDFAELIVDALLDANIVNKQHFVRAVKIVAEELDARKAVGDY